MYKNGRKKLNEIERLRQKLNYFKNAGMKDPFKDLTLFISLE